MVFIFIQLAWAFLFAILAGFQLGAQSYIWTVIDIVIAVLCLMIAGLLSSRYAK